VEENAILAQKELEEAKEFQGRTIKRTIYFTLGLILLGIILMVIFINKFKS
jgi:hypothetical protein